MVSVAPLRVSFGTGRYLSATENDYVLTTAQGGPTKPALIVCHPHGASAHSMVQTPEYVRLYRDLAEKYVVSVSDLGGGDAWGNVDTYNAIAYIRLQLIRDFGAYDGKIAVLGISMGGLASLNALKADPTYFAISANIVPAINMSNLQTYSGGIFNAEIDAAYGGNYQDSNQGPTKSPYIYRNNFAAQAAATKCALWYSETDEVVRAQDAVAFLDANPNIEGYKISTSGGGGYGHGFAVAPAVDGMAVGSAFDFPKVADWCNQRIADTSFVV